MSREDIIRLAKEAKAWQLPHLIDHDGLERFAALVAAAEREQCAKVCEDIPLPQNAPELTHLPTIERCANAIRARGTP